MLKEINFKIVLLIIAASFAFGILFNSLSKNGLDFIRKEKFLEFVSLENNSVNLKQNNSNVNDEVSEPVLIKLDDAFHLYSTGEIIFIDARDQWDFKERHVMGAVNIPEYKFEKDMPIIKALKKDFSYIVYCGDEECDVSKRLAIELSKIGFKNLMILEGGWTTWMEKNYPTESK